MPQLLRPSSPADKLRQPASLRHLKPRAQRSKTMTSHSLRVCSVVAIEPVGARACMREGQADRMANRSVFGGCVVGPDRPLQHFARVDSNACFYDEVLSVPERIGNYFDEGSSGITGSQPERSRSGITGGATAQPERVDSSGRVRRPRRMKLSTMRPSTPADAAAANTCARMTEDSGGMGLPSMGSKNRGSSGSGWRPNRSQKAR